MIFRCINRRVTSIVALMALVCIAGCGKSYQVAEVDGVLIVKGKPAPKVRLQFIPDIDQGAKGPAAFGVTDAQGKFKLEYLEPGGTTPQPGAVVGWHRVVLSDMQLAESATGQGVPIRFGPEYTLPGSSPLKQEVKEGKQTIELKVP
jgi:hypothetical protein